MLILELKIEALLNSQVTLEVTGVSPDRLATLSLKQIQDHPVYLGAERCRLGEYFSVSGDPAAQHHLWKGECQRVSGIGAEMTSGWIQIEGNTGNHLGSRMSGGAIQVQGSAGNFVGCEMTEGLIHVKGDVGSHVGSAYDGGVSGQNGGAILIEGSAGNCVGESMRRGLIAVAGDVGNCCGLAMRAGTIILHGSFGKNLGAEMTRGTIVLTNSDQSSRPFEPEGFVTAGVQPMPVISLINRYTAELGFSRLIGESDVQIWHGDLLRGGRGELLEVIAS